MDEINKLNKVNIGKNIIYADFISVISKFSLICIVIFGFLNYLGGLMLNTLMPSEILWLEIITIPIFLTSLFFIIVAIFIKKGRKWAGIASLFFPVVAIFLGILCFYSGNIVALFEKEGVFQLYNNDDFRTVMTNDEEFKKLSPVDSSPFEVLALNTEATSVYFEGEKYDVTGLKGPFYPILNKGFIFFGYSSQVGQGIYFFNANNKKISTISKCEDCRIALYQNGDMIVAQYNNWLSYSGDSTYDAERDIVVFMKDGSIKKIGKYVDYKPKVNFGKSFWANDKFYFQFGDLFYETSINNTK